MATRFNLPGTAERVEKHTSDRVNARIRQQMRERVALFYGIDHAAIDRRIGEDRDWRIAERKRTSRVRR